MSARCRSTALLEAGHDVVVLDDLTTGHRGAVPDGATLVVGDYGDRATVDRVLAEQRVEAILHCAARSLVGESIRDPGRYYRDNVGGGVALLDAARSAGVERLVFSSTAAVYGVPGSTPITEDAPLRPINPYGETKRTFEGALAWYGQAYGLRSVSLALLQRRRRDRRRSARTTTRRPTSSRPSSRAVERGEPVTLFGDDYPTPDGTCIRDYIHVGDLADAHLRALEATAPDDPRTDDGALACNLGNGGGFSVREVLAAAETVVGGPIPVDRRPRDAPAIRRSSSPAPSARPRGPRLATGPPGPRRRWSPRPGPGGSAIPAATG